MTIHVTSARGPYQVLIEPGAITKLHALLRARGLDGRRLVVSTPPVWRRHGRRLRLVAARGARPALIPDGERGKTLAVAARLYDACLERDLDRASTVIAFGGGVVGDVAGFAAATFLRGVSLVQAPTTLLAQVDSAIGGKVGVNLPAGKNLVGAFHPPALVVCDPRVLATLPAREFRAGMFEVVKYGVIASPALFARLERQLDLLFAQDESTLAAVIAACCRIKADVVMADEHERGPRRALNFGHTVGHALETVTRYRRFRHGEAVGYGMRAAAQLSMMRGLMTPEAGTRLKRLIDRLGRLPATSDLKVADALDAIRHDKKVVRGRLHFVLAHELGATKIVSDVTERELAIVLRGIGLT